MAELLRRLSDGGLQCTGASATGLDEIDLWVGGLLEGTPTTELLARAFPGAMGGLVVQRRPEGQRLRLELAPGLWVSWSEAGPLPAEATAPRLQAYEVGLGDEAEAEAEEVVMAGTPDEAAGYYARGWGLRTGALVLVTWEDAGPQAAILDGRQQRLFRVVGPGLVRLLPA